MISTFKALSDRNRLRIVAALTTYKELCACQVTELLQVSGATASKHMGILISAGLVESRKDGRWVYYRQSSNTNQLDAVYDWMTAEFSKSKEIKADLKVLKSIIAQSPEDLCRKQRGLDCCPK